jgi:nucleotide-binding universal stress UspA family protein
VARAILGYARDRRIDLVIVGSHGRGKAAQLLVGSVAEKIVRHASCPVLTIREARPDSGTVTPVPAAGS